MAATGLRTGTESGLQADSPLVRGPSGPLTTAIGACPPFGRPGFPLTQNRGPPWTIERGRKPIRVGWRQSPVTVQRHPALALVYQLLLGLASGFAVGVFAWMIAGRFIDTGETLWPYTVTGIIVMTVTVRALAARPGGRRWIHLLWIPVVLFVALMTMVIIALRNFE